MQLMQLLRRHRRPVSGWELAGEMAVSLRTLYRDIASLKAQGAEIDGEPGYGYVMKPGFVLPPLMFSSVEVEALMLGMRWVADRGDPVLAAGARDAAARIAAVLPRALRRELETSALLVGTSLRKSAPTATIEPMRAAIRGGLKMKLTYRDKQGAISHRVIWPFAVVYFEEARVLAAWCELRGDFRNFRADLIVQLEPLEERQPKPKNVLLDAWRQMLKTSGLTILPESDSLPF
ncbi:YafY family protein [Variovorax sp. H27-G14]|uniref:helix-turn-helix transcriptional regulator n=1 Tax=Variovorax sp. H27-G14 TaxID=3111914 RepID=UPI0038FC808C